MAQITAKIDRHQPGYLRIQASDGMTYCRCSDMFRGKVRHTYCTWATGSRDPDAEIDWVRMPKAVRAIMRATLILAAAA